MKKYKENLQKRLDVLESSGVISKRSSDVVMHSLGQLISYAKFPNNQEAFDIFFTHLALSTERALLNKQLEDYDKLIEGELRMQNDYSKIKKMVALIENDANLKFTDAEKIFIMLHLCSIVSN